MKTTATALFGFRRVSALCSLLFAVVWVPLTSHELLESIEWIHHEADAEHPGAAHEQADGIVRVQSSKVPVKEPALVPLDNFPIPAATVAVGLMRWTEVVLPVGRDAQAPPGLVQDWHFALRLALPGRAP